MKRRNYDYYTIYKRLIQRFVLSTVILLIVFVTRQIIIQYQIHHERNMSSVINISGRQRMLSQKITKDVLIINEFKDASQSADYLNDLKEALEQWKTSQANLINGNHAAGIDNNNSEVIRAKYNDVAPYFKNISDAAHAFLSLSEREIYDQSQADQQIAIIKQNEEVYLVKMNEIVNQYDLETRHSIALIKETELVLFIIAVLSLLFITVFIIYPISQTLKSALWEVEQSKKNVARLFRSMRGGLFIVKFDGEIVSMNSDAERLVIPEGTQESRLRVDKNVKWKALNIMHVIDKAQRQERVDDIETVVEDKDGNLLYMIVSIVEGLYEGERVALLGTYDITSQKQAEEALKNLVTRDKLTGLYNRAFVDTIITEEIERSDRYEIPMSAYILDLDHFKIINDTWGHPVGDTVLKMTADILVNHTRMSDYAIRIGGEEFIVIMPQTNIEGAYTAAETVRQVIENTAHPVVGKVTASFGVVERFKGELYHSLYSRMDNALYEAKESGRNRVVKAAYQGEENTYLSLSWKNAWNCGEKKIDEQHRELYRMISRLVSSFMLPLERDMAVSRIELLIDKLSEHFKYEEDVLDRMGYEESIKHKDVHSYLLDKTKVIRDGVAREEMEPTSAFIYLFDEVIVSHLLREDVKFFPIFSSGESEE